MADMPEDLPIKVEILRNDHENLRRHVERMDNDLAEIKLLIDEKMDALKQSMDRVTMGALNSMPAWAADALNHRNTIIAILAGLLGAAFAAVGVMVPFLK